MQPANSNTVFSVGCDGADSVLRFCFWICRPASCRLRAGDAILPPCVHVSNQIDLCKPAACRTVISASGVRCARCVAVRSPRQPMVPSRPMQLRSALAACRSLGSSWVQSCMSNTLFWRYAALESKLILASMHITARVRGHGEFTTEDVAVGQ